MEKLMLNVKQNPGFIELNFDELEKGLDAKLAEYDGAVFTEESKDIAKSEVAGLRKLKKSFEDARKAVKKEWMKPYDEFESKMKHLTGKIDEPICLIDSQLKEFEEKRRVEKRGKIRAVYEKLIDDMEAYVPLEKIYNPKWENATVTMKSIQEDMTVVIESAKMAVETISAMQSEAVPKALEIYKTSLDMAKAVAYINNYETQRAEIMRREEERRQQEEERRRQAEIERIRAEERAAVEREQAIPEEAEKQAEVQETEPIPPVEDEEDMLPFEQPSTKTVFYRVVGTPEELEEVEMAFNSLGIYFERREA